MSENQIEEWKDIPGYEGMYQISSFGRVKSLARNMPHKTYGTWHVKERILKPFWSGEKSSQYLAVFLHSGSGNQKVFRIHRLVAENFIAKETGKDFVNHKDCDRGNNNVDNLEWVTAKENAQHAWANGRCEDVGFKKHAVVNIDTGERFASIKDACLRYGVTSRAIYQSASMENRKCRGYRWKYADA